MKINLATLLLINGISAICDFNTTEINYSMGGPSDLLVSEQND